MSKSTVIETIEMVLKVVPNGEPFKAELKAFRDGIFMELPESNRHLWAGASAIFLRHFPSDDNEYMGWQYAAESIWMEAQKRA